MCDIAEDISPSTPERERLQRKISGSSLVTDFKENGPVNARSGTSGVVATVFGASGFLGRYITSYLGALCSHLRRVLAIPAPAGESGAIVFVAHRGEEYEVRHLKVCGDLGMVQPFHFELRDRASVLEAMSRSDVVFNCIGKEHSTFHYTVEEANADSARIIAEVAPMRIASNRLCSHAHARATPAMRLRTRPFVLTALGSAVRRGSRRAETSPRLLPLCARACTDCDRKS